MTTLVAVFIIVVLVAAVVVPLVCFLIVLPAIFVYENFYKPRKADPERIDVDPMTHVRSELSPGERLLAAGNVVGTVVGAHIFTPDEDDEAVILGVSDRSLVVVRRGSIRTFPLSSIQSIKIGSRRVRKSIVPHLVVDLTNSETLAVGQLKIPLVFRGRRGIDREEAESVFSSVRTAMGAQQGASPLAGGIAQEIAKLSTLALDGVISADDLERAKTMLLGQPPDAREQSVTLLRKLSDLRKQRILSESEFNSKKWEVLARQDFR